jgi:AbiV family abortive infection protein
MSSHPSLTPDACAAGADAAARNSGRLALAAGRLHRDRFFGPAASLYVTSLEEAVKGLALVLASATAENGEVREQVRQPLMSLVAGRDSHRRRHAVASLATLKEWADPLEDALPKGALTVAVGIALLLLLLGLARDEEFVQELTVAGVVGALSVEPDSAEGWFRRAWDVRQAGLYVDQDGAGWRTPDVVQKSDAEEARQQVLPLVRGIRLAINQAVGESEGQSSNG